MPKSIHQQVEEMLTQIQQERSRPGPATEPQQPAREAVPDATNEEEEAAVERVLHLYVLTDEQVQEQEQEASSVEADPPAPQPEHPVDRPRLSVGHERGPGHAHRSLAHHSRPG